MYVASVASGCFKSRLSVVSPSSPFAASPRCLLSSRRLASEPEAQADAALSHLLGAGDVRGGAGPHVRRAKWSAGVVVSIK
jgi:hypothetical protein